MNSQLFERCNARVGRKPGNTVRLKKSAGIFATALLLILILAACEKKDLCMMVHPHDKKVCHTTLTLQFNTAWENAPIYTTYTGTTSTPTPEEGMPMRYIVEFWTTNEEGAPDTLIGRKDFIQGTLANGDNSVTLKADLPAMPVITLCWAEPLIDGVNKNPCFNTDQLREVTLNTPLGYDIGKEAFTNSTVLDYSKHIHEYDGIDLTENLTLLRPFGRYAIITNDVKEYREKEGADAPLPTTSDVRYQLWIPMAFDVVRQIPVQPEASKSYTFTPSMYVPNEEMKLSEDFLFVGTKDTESNYYNLTIFTYDSYGETIHKSGNVEIRVKRNFQTLVYGAFLTDRKTNTPGVDDSFDGEIDVTIPD